MKIKKLFIIICFSFISISISNAQSLPNYVSANGLLAWYAFNANGNDASVNANHATNFGAAFISDRNGNTSAAAGFNGSSQYMQVAAPNFTFSENGSFTYAVWVNKANTNIGVFLMSGTTAGGNFISLMQGQSDIKFGTNMQQSAWTWASGVLSVNTWDHFVATYDNKVMNLYKNGVFQSTATYPYTGASTATLPLYIGRGVSGSFYEGSLDDVGIWNRVLTQSEIIDLLNSCTQAFTVQPDSQSVNMNMNVQYNAVSSDAGSVYQWQEDTGTGFSNLVNGGQYAGVSTNTLTIISAMLSQDNNRYRCIITSGACTDTSEIALLTVINNTGLDNIFKADLFSVFPNPASKLVNLKVQKALIGSEYKFYDQNGKMLISGKVISEKQKIDISHLANGLYLVQVGIHPAQQFKLIKLN